MSSEYILFIHRGVSWYLYYAVKQARFYHPQARIVILTDEESPRELLQEASIHRLRDYWSSAAKLEKQLERLVSNSHELFHLQRWFVIHEFLSRHRPARTVCLNSDVLVYGNLFRDFQRMDEQTLGVVGYQSPSAVLVPDPSVVLHVCERIERLRRKELSFIEPCRGRFLQTRERGRERSSAFLDAVKTLDLSVPEDGSVYDLSIQESDGFCARDGIKEITWVCSEPWVRRKDTGEDVRLKTIHCKGAAKCWILRFFTAKDLCFWRERAAEEVRMLAGGAMARC